MRWVPTIAVILAPVGSALDMISRDRVSQWLGWAGALPPFCVFAVCLLFTLQPRPLNGTLKQPLDEREIILRLNAYVRGLTLPCLIACLGCGYMRFAAQFDWWAPSGKDDWNALFWALGCWMAGMPLAFANWQTPAPLDDEDNQ